MGQSSFAQSLLAATCVTGVMFSVAALPFAALKSNVINVELQNQPIFNSELQYLAAPYLSVTGAMSVAVGVGIFGVLGWRNSARKLVSAEASKSDLTKNLATYQAELERIKFSDARLRTQNLSGFLQPETAWAAPASPVVAVPAPVVEPPAIMPLHRVPQPLAQPQVVTNVAHPDAAVPAISHPKPTFAEVPHAVPVEESAEPLESLLSQLQSLSRQVEELRNHSSRHLAA